MAGDFQLDKKYCGRVTTKILRTKQWPVTGFAMRLLDARQGFSKHRNRASAEKYILSESGTTGFGTSSGNVNTCALQKVGLPLGTGSPEKARSVVSVVFTPTRGVIHPSFPLRGRWERVAKNDEQAPSPSLTASYFPSCGTRLRRVLMQEQRQSNFIGGP
jgi:hypothetical protein